jgi:hypothetical protein
VSPESGCITEGCSALVISLLEKFSVVLKSSVIGDERRDHIHEVGPEELLNDNLP